MRRSLAALVLSIAGCSEYELHRVPEDTGMEADGMNSHGTLENYNSCDPYDAGWDIAPEGAERPGCFGIEHAFLEYKENSFGGGFFTTQLYSGACAGFQDDAFGSIYEEVDPDNWGVGFGAVGGGECGTDSNGFFEYQVYVYPSSLEDTIYSYSLWIANDGQEGDLHSEEVRQTADPMRGSIDCRDAAELADCAITLYH